MTHPEASPAEQLFAPEQQLQAHIWQLVDHLHTLQWPLIKDARDLPSEQPDEHDFVGMAYAYMRNPDNPLGGKLTMVAELIESTYKDLRHLHQRVTPQQLRQVIIEQLHAPAFGDDDVWWCDYAGTRLSPAAILPAPVVWDGLFARRDKVDVVALRRWVEQTAYGHGDLPPVPRAVPPL